MRAIVYGLSAFETESSTAVVTSGALPVAGAVAEVPALPGLIGADEPGELVESVGSLPQPDSAARHASSAKLLRFTVCLPLGASRPLRIV